MSSNRYGAVLIIHNLDYKDNPLVTVLRNTKRLEEIPEAVDQLYDAAIRQLNAKIEEFSNLLNSMEEENVPHDRHER